MRALIPLFAVSVAALAVPGSAWAQKMVAPDAKQHPELAAMKRWLDTATPQAQHCLWSGGLFVEADALYRQNQSESKTIDAMMEKHADKVVVTGRERLREVITGVTAMAAGFATLEADSAPIAYSQLCIGRAQKGGELTPATLQHRFTVAQACESNYKPGSLDRKECIAKAFRMK